MTFKDVARTLYNLFSMGIANRISRFAIILLRDLVIVETLGILLFIQQSGTSLENFLAEIDSSYCQSPDPIRKLKL